MKDLIEKAKELMQWAEDYGIDEISISNGEEKIAISRNGQGVPVVPANTQVVSAPARAQTPKKKKQASPENEVSGEGITSPMVGTFYSAPSPEAPPFKGVGDRVKVGDTVCIVEAMKVMNQIKSPYEGVVKKILVNNAEVVYKGQVLFEIG